MPGTVQAGVACHSADEFASQTDFYLEHEQQRQEISLASRASVLATSDYKPRLARMLQALADSDAA